MQLEAFRKAKAEEAAAKRAAKAATPAAPPATTTTRAEPSPVAASDACGVGLLAADKSNAAQQATAAEGAAPLQDGGAAGFDSGRVAAYQTGLSGVPGARPTMSETLPGPIADPRLQLPPQFRPSLAAQPEPPQQQAQPWLQPALAPLSAPQQSQEPQDLGQHSRVAFTSVPAADAGSPFRSAAPSSPGKPTVAKVVSSTGPIPFWTPSQGAATSVAPPPAMASTSHFHSKAGREGFGAAAMTATEGAADGLSQNGTAAKFPAASASAMAPGHMLSGGDASDGSAALADQPAALRSPSETKMRQLDVQSRSAGSSSASPSTTSALVAPPGQQPPAVPDHRAATSSWAAATPADLPWSTSQPPPEPVTAPDSLTATPAHARDTAALGSSATQPEPSPFLTDTSQGTSAFLGGSTALDPAFVHREEASDRLTGEGGGCAEHTLLPSQQSGPVLAASADSPGTELHSRLASGNLLRAGSIARAAACVPLHLLLMLHNDNLLCRPLHSMD